MNELTYTMQGDYNLPDLTMPEQPEVTLGRYAQMRRKFLKEHHKIWYYNLLTSCTLTQHLAETEQTALRLEETLIKQMAAQEGLTEMPESGGYDEVGAGNEQSEEQSAGDRESGGHLRLGYYSTEATRQGACRFSAGTIPSVKSSAQRPT